MRAWNSISACGYIINPDFRQVQGPNGTTSRMQWSMAFPDPSDPKSNEKTTWITCTAWGNQAEIVEKYCTEIDGEGKMIARKGAAVGVVGSLVVEKFTDRQGVLRTSTKIKVRELHLMSAKQEDDEAPVQRPSKQQQQQQQQRRRQQQPSPAAPQNNNNRIQQPGKVVSIPDLPF